MNEEIKCTIETVIDPALMKEIIRAMARTGVYNRSSHAFIVFVFLFCLISGILCLIAVPHSFSGIINLGLAGAVFAFNLYLTRRIIARNMELYEKAFAVTGGTMTYQLDFYDDHMKFTNVAAFNETVFSYRLLKRTRHLHTRHLYIWLVMQRDGGYVQYIPITKEDRKKYQVDAILKGKK